MKTTPKSTSPISVMPIESINLMFKSAMTKAGIASEYKIDLFLHLCAVLVKTYSKSFTFSDFLSISGNVEGITIDEYKKFFARYCELLEIHKRVSKLEARIAPYGQDTFFLCV